MKYLFIVLAVLFVPYSAHAQQKESFEIGILIDTMSVEIEPLINALQSEIRAVVGEDARVEFPESNILANGFSETRAEQRYQALLAGDADLIIAFGGINNRVIAGRADYPKPTILFGTLNTDLVDVDLTAESSNIPNFNYLITSQSYKKDLETFKELYDYQHLAVLIDDALPIVDMARIVFDPLFESLDASYTLISYADPEDLDVHLNTIDGVYLAEGLLMDSGEIEDLASYLFDQRIPSFTSTTAGDVASGLMATNQSEENLSVFLRRIALNVDAVIRGEDLGTLPLSIQVNPELTINFNTAEQVGVPIRYKLIAATNFVGDFKNVLSEDTYSLLDVIEEVLGQNLLLRQSEKNIELAAQDVRSAKSTYLPDLSGSVTGVYVDEETATLSNGQNPEYTLGGSLTLTQTLFSDAANANIEIQKDLYGAEQENFNATELDLILQAANIYFNILILKSNLQIQSENLDLTRQNLQIAEENFEAGQSGQSDVLRFRSEVARNTQNLVEAANQLEQGFFLLNQLLNSSIAREIDVEEAQISEGLFERYMYRRFLELLDNPSLRDIFTEFLVEEAQNNAPEIKSLDYSLKATDRVISLNGIRTYIPSIGAQAQYNRTFDRWGAGVPPPEFTLDENLSVGLTLTIPLFSQDARRINRQTAIIQKEQLELGRDNAVLDIEENVRSAVLDLINQVANIELSSVSEASAWESLDLTQAAYTNGAVPITQLLDAQNNYLQAQLASANAGYNYLLSSLMLERMIGRYFLLQTPAANDAFVARFFEYVNRSTE